VNILAGEEDMEYWNSLRLALLRIFALRAAHHLVVSRLISVLVIAVLLCTQAASVEAEQVTFAFEATISDVADPNGLTISLPFQPTVGQTITGSVTFTPIPFSQSSGQDGKLDIFLGDESFSASDLRLTSENDVFVVVGSNVQGPFDSLSVSCGISTQCPNTSTSVTGIEVLFLGLGLGGGDILPSGAPIDTPVSWNLFPNRRLVLTLANDSGSAILTIGADIGPVRAVPEPSSILPLGCLGACWAFRRWRRQ
jgi:hypothetical protein